MHIEKQGKQLVWCVSLSDVPYLYYLFDWEPLPQERRQQLYEAAKTEGMRLHETRRKMQQRYTALLPAINQQEDAFPTPRLLNNQRISIAAASVVLCGTPGTVLGDQTSRFFYSNPPFT